MSSSISERWLRAVLHLRKGDELELTLHVVVDEFFAVLPAQASQLSMHSLAACALFYRLAPAAKIRKGQMPLEPALRLLHNAHGERGKQYVPPEQFGADVLVPALRMPAYWRRLKGDEI